MTWFLYLGLPVAAILALRLVYVQGYKNGLQDASRKSRWVEPLLERWIKVNDRFVSDLSRAGLEDDAEARRRNFRLLYEVRHLRKKVVRLAFKYGDASHRLKVATSIKPKDFGASVLLYTTEAILSSLKDKP